MQLHFLIPGRLETRTGGYEYDRRIAAGLRESGWDVVLHRLDDSYPFPTPQAQAHTSELLAALPDGKLVLIDGLALGGMPEDAEAHGRRLRLVALVHHPLAAETGLGAVEVGKLQRSEQRALARVRHVVVTSAATTLSLARYAVEGSRITVVEPGTDAAPLARGSGGGEVMHLLCVAAVVARKGHDLLVEALAGLGRGGWRLTCVGSLDRQPQFAAALLERVRMLGIEDRVAFAGEAQEGMMSAHYDGADLFVLPTLHEGYGMVVAEALARGLPVVATGTGAIPSLVGDSAGVIVAPGDQGALRAALQLVIGDRTVLARLTAGARVARDRLPTWADATRTMAGALTAVARS